MTASPSAPSAEEIAALLRATIRIDASGLAPAVVSHYIDGFDESGRAIMGLFGHPSEATRATSAPVRPNSDAMPGEEEIAKLLMKLFYDQWFAPGKPAWGGSVYWDFVNGSSAWSQQAQRILALFAPILAEKERRIAEWQAEVRREGDRFKDEVRDLNAECERLEARALAAEAAREQAVWALNVSRVAVDDWLNIYASELCDEKRVAQAHARITDSGGTLAYIARVQGATRDALAQIAAPDAAMEAQDGH